jgi:transposase
MPRRTFNRNQAWLLPPSLDELIDVHHAVRFVAAFVDGLDLRALGFEDGGQTMGAASYEPIVLVSAWVYGFMCGIRSSRGLEKAAHEHIPVMWLLGSQHPDHTTLARFFKSHREAFRDLFKRTVREAIAANMVDFALQAVDGTRVSSLARDKTLGQEELKALWVKTEEAIVQLERELASEGELAEDQVAGRDIATELAGMKEKQARIKAAEAEIERREEARRSDHPERASKKQGQGATAKVHLADLEAVTMKGRHGLVTGYNAQAAVDSKEQVIVGSEVAASATDNDLLMPMLETIEDVVGKLAEKTVLDAGYHSADNLDASQQVETDLYLADPELRRQAGPQKWAYHKDHFEYEAEQDVYTCPAGQTLRYEYTTRRKGEDTPSIRVYRCRDCADCAHKKDCTKDVKGRRIRIRAEDELLKQNRRKLLMESSQEIMKRRGAVVEPVFAILREHHNLRRFLRRGLKNVRAEWHLLCAAYNLKKIWRFLWGRDCVQAEAVG